MTVFKCMECGENFIKDLMEEAYVGNRCFDCSFWQEKLSLKESGDPRQVIVDGEHYMAMEDDGGPMKGFGGADFSIEYFDGRRIECNNLWHQGEIPEQFRDRLPDNAKFISTERDDHSMTGGIPF